MDPLNLTVDVVDPSDPEYGDYQYRVISTPSVNDGASEAEAAEAWRRSPVRRMSRAVAEALAGDPELVGKQFRVRAHR